MNSIRYDIRLDKKMMREHRIAETIKEGKKLALCIVIAFGLALAFFGGMSLLQKIVSLSN